MLHSSLLPLSSSSISVLCHLSTHFSRTSSRKPGSQFRYLHAITSDGSLTSLSALFFLLLTFSSFSSFSFSHIFDPHSTVNTHTAHEEMCSLGTPGSLLGKNQPVLRFRSGSLFGLRIFFLLSFSALLFVVVRFCVKLVVRGPQLWTQRMFTHTRGRDFDFFNFFNSIIFH